MVVMLLAALFDRQTDLFASSAQEQCKLLHNAVTLYCTSACKDLRYFASE
jgi:hypothetical protein